MSAAPAARGLLVGVAAILIIAIGLSTALVARCSVPDDTTIARSTEIQSAKPNDVPHVNLFERPDGFLSALREHLGTPLNVHRVGIYDRYGFAVVQDPDQPHHLDEHGFRDGVLDPVADPVAAGRYETWDREVFPLEQIHAAVVRQVALAALAEFDELEHPRISHVVIERSWEPGSDHEGGNEHRQDTGPVQISVYVDDPVRGGSGRIVADTQGSILDVYRS